MQEPTPELNNIVMSCLRTRERYISSCVGLSPSLNVCTRNSQTYTVMYSHIGGSTEKFIMTEKRKRDLLLYSNSTAIIAHRLSVHMGSIPRATSKSTSFPASVGATGD